MNVVKLSASRFGDGYGNFQKSILNGMPIARLLPHTPLPAKTQILNRWKRGALVPVWALRGGKSRTVWSRLKPGDLALFYTDDAFTHCAEIIATFESQDIENLAEWKKDGRGAYTLIIVFGAVHNCTLSRRDYEAVLNYAKMPMQAIRHSDEESVELLSMLQWLDKRKPIASDGAEDDDDLDEEGRRVYKIQAMRERSEGNRLHVLEKKGYQCEVCLFNFRSAYGNELRDSAQVHHKRPLALGQRRKAVLDDFAVLCAHCHQAAHMGKGRKLNPRSTEELKELLRRGKSTSP